MSVVQLGLPGTFDDPTYPGGDGREMGESEYHLNAITWLREALRRMFAQRGVLDAYVISLLTVYYQHGNPAAKRDPDVMVVLGVSPHARFAWRVWDEGGRLPDVAFEVSSQSTVAEDLGPKHTLYAQLGIREYFLFDPTGQFLAPPLLGFRLVGAAYQPIAPGPGGELDSVQLNARLEPQGDMLRVIDLTTGLPVLTHQEHAELEAERADNEAERADQAELRAADLQAQLDRLKAQIAQQQPPTP